MSNLEGFQRELDALIERRFGAERSLMVSEEIVRILVARAHVELWRDLDGKKKYATPFHVIAGEIARLMHIHLRQLNGKTRGVRPTRS